MPSMVPSFELTWVSWMRPEPFVLRNGWLCSVRPRAQVFARSACPRNARYLFGGFRITFKGAERREHEVEAVVLHRYLDALGDKVHDRLIDAAMPVFELHHFGASSLAEHLMPEADAEERHFSEQLFYLGERTFDVVGISRAVAQEHAIGLEREHLFGRRYPTAPR